MFILKKGHKPGVYVPLRALFLVLYVGSPTDSLNLGVNQLQKIPKQLFGSI